MKCVQNNVNMLVLNNEVMLPNNKYDYDRYNIIRKQNSNNKIIKTKVSRLDAK